MKNGLVYFDNSGENDIPDGEYLSLEEYGKSYGISPETLRVMIHRRQIPSIKVLHQRYIPVGSLPKKRRQ